MKKLVKILLVALLACACLAACGGETGGNNEEKVSFGFVTDIGGIDDKSFNQTSWEGAKKFADEVGLVEGTDYKYLQSDSESDYTPNLTTFADEEVDLIIAAGYLFADAIQATVNNYPDQKILIIDVDYLAGENLQQAVFAEHEGSFLVGVAAGLQAKAAGKTTVGYIVGMESVTMDKFEAGYQDGVWAVCPECTILRDNANDFGAPETGKSLAAKQYDAGAYVIYHAAGGTGNGVIQEAAERRANGEDVWVCGVDTDQYDYGKYGDGSKSAVLTSMMKRVDVAAYNALKAVEAGTFEGKVVVYDLAGGGVSLPAENPNLSEDILKAVEDYTAKIVNGEIKVNVTPKTQAEDARVVGQK
ncbi:MAG: BMP family ABC transporter substrate-binding protein [Erysipelotrichaceae bacterium]|nr:BMP family ABC transporter substrate-binding protein [Erysipelotrichaceae bacterium]